MNNIFSTAVKLLFRLKFRLVILLLGVMLTIIISTTITSYSLGLEEGFNNFINDTFGNLDLLITDTSGDVFEYSELEKKMDDIEVKEISKLLSGNDLSIKVNESVYSEIYTVGIDNTNMSLIRYSLKDKINSHEVVINKKTSESLSIKMDDTILIGYENNYNEYKVADIVDDRQDILIVLLNINDIYSINNKYGFISAALIDLGENEDSSIKKLKSFQELNVNVLKEDSEVEEVYKYSAGLSKIFIAITVLITILLISLNFKLVIIEDGEAIKTLKYIGISTFDINKMFFYQAFVIISICFICGTGISLLLSDITFSIISEHISKLPYVNPTISYKVILINILVALLALFLTMIPVVFNANNKKVKEENNTKKISAFRKLIPVILMILGFVLIAVSAIIPDLGSIAILGLIVITIVIIMFTSNYILSFLIKLSEILFSKGQISKVAILQLKTFIQKNQVLIHTIALALVILVLGNSILKTIENNMNNTVEREYGTSYIAKNINREFTLLDYNNHLEFEGIDNINQAIFVGHTDWFTIEKVNDVELEDGNIMYTMIDSAKFNNLDRNDLVINIDEIIITREMSDKYDINKNDILEVSYFSKNGEIFEKYKVIDINDNYPGIWLGSSVINYNVENKGLNAYILDKFLLVLEDNNYKFSQTDISNLIGNKEGLIISSKEEALKDIILTINQRFTVIKIVVALFYIIGITGIILTFQSFIESNIREYGVLRIIAYTNWDVINIVILQVVLVFIYSLIEGCLLSLIYVFSIVYGMKELIVIDWKTVLISVNMSIIFSIISTLPIILKLKGDKVQSVLRS